MSEGISGSSCLGLLRGNLSQLTAAQRRFADYVFDHPGVIHQSITETVAQSGVGYGTIVRFCQDLGYDGFQDFKVNLAADLAIHDADSRSSDRSDWLGVESAIEDLRNTASILDRTNLENAAVVIAKARKVLIAGSAGSFPQAVALEYRLTRSGVETVSISDNHMQRARAALLNERDVALVVSFSGSTKDAIEVGRIAKSLGAAVIVITNFQRSPLVDLADYVLSTSIRADPLRAEITSTVAVSYLVDLLATNVHKRKRGSGEALESTFRASAERQI